MRNSELIPVVLEFKNEIIWKIIPDKHAPYIAIQTRHKENQVSSFYRFNIVEKKIDLHFNSLQESFNLDLQGIANGYILLHRFDVKNPVLANNIICLSNKHEKIQWESYRYKLIQTHEIALEANDSKSMNSPPVLLNYTFGEQLKNPDFKKSNTEITEFDPIEKNEIVEGGEKKYGKFLVIENNKLKIIADIDNSKIENSFQLLIEQNEKIIYKHTFENAQKEILNFRLINNSLMLIKNQEELVHFSL